MISPVPPASFEYHHVATTAATTTGEKNAFQTQASAKQALEFESCLSGRCKMQLLCGRSSRCPPQADLEERLSTWKKAFGRSSLASNSRARSGHNFWQVCFWSWKIHRHAERRERTDARPDRHL